MSRTNDAGPSEESGASQPVTEAVVQTLVANHRAFISFLERRLGDRALAQDILQEAFARGLEHIETLRDGESAVAWFYRLLRNAVVDHHRRQGSATRALERAAGEAATAEPDTELRAVVCQCVSQLVSTLKPEYGQALRRIELDGLTMQQFAQEAGVTANNAAVRVFRARQALRSQVLLTCGTCAEHGYLDCHCHANEAPLTG